MEKIETNFSLPRAKMSKTPFLPFLLVHSAFSSSLSTLNKGPDADPKPEVSQVENTTGDCCHRRDTVVGVEQP